MAAQSEMPATLGYNHTRAHGRLIAMKRVVHIADLRTDQAYRDGALTTVLLVEAPGARS